MNKFLDGITSLYNDLINQRSAQSSNSITSSRVHDAELKAIYKTGLGSKIVRIKSGYALKDAFQFDNDELELYYNTKLAKDVKRAVQFCVGFGRGIIVLFEKGEDLSQPRRISFDRSRVQLRVFSGDMVSAMSPELDLMSQRYNKPEFYQVKGANIHYTRVVDFTYFNPPEIDAPTYRYGGISEFELIYPQIVNDAIVERASPSILEKNSTIFYKVAGFKNLLGDKREGDLLKYFSTVENRRSIYGAGILDKEDEVQSITQALTNLSETDMITLRRLAMVTGIPLAWLVGENVQGLNSTGDNERQIFREMIDALKFDYIIDPINELMSKIGAPSVVLRDNQGGTALERIEYESKAIQNAQALYHMGEDHTKYLVDAGVIVKDAVSDFFTSSDGTDLFALPDLSEDDETTD